MRSLFIAMVFSFLALGCGKNQFVPVNETASAPVKTDGVDAITLAEDGEYEVITPESLSSGNVQALVERAKQQAKPAVQEFIPAEAFNDPDFGTSKGDDKARDLKSEDVMAETPKETPKTESPKPEAPQSSDAPQEIPGWQTLPQTDVPVFPAPEKEDVESEMSLDVVNDSDISMRSKLRPSVYYYPVINEDKRKCEKNYILRGANGEKIISLCERTRVSCRLQGSCAIIQNGKKRTFNISNSNAVNGKDRFFETSKDECRYGFGVKSSCLDPFYTVAADLSIYHPGDVIYVPKVRGTVLPDGSKHSGYFLVRDKGLNIIGKTRFDFYSGHVPWWDKENPFSKIGLANKANRFEFMKIEGPKAKAFAELRGYPKLPHNTVKH